MNQSLFSTVTSLRGLLGEMLRGRRDMKQMGKTAALMLNAGVSPAQIPEEAARRVLADQGGDGGWGSVIGSAWNVFYLKSLNAPEYREVISRGVDWLERQAGPSGLWGGSLRDAPRIPVSSVILCFIPELVSGSRLAELDNLWRAEKESGAYKTAYALMAFKANEYIPVQEGSREEMVDGLIRSQRPGGGFAPAAGAPAPDVYCTALALLGLIQYPMLTPRNVLDKTADWLWISRRGNGLWDYDDVAEGSSWALYALYTLQRLSVG